ncbi:MAG: dihydroorotate dehydrogenase electron transfer subunit [Planctomycetota bacterium]|jgi:dihydroorotate dehydrogenase electron transfer subunit
MHLDAVDDSISAIQIANVVSLSRLCREHFQLTLEMNAFRDARPGQFVHIKPQAYMTHTNGDAGVPVDEPTFPLLRRAFSIAALRRLESRVQIDLIFRVVGTATRWMSGLLRGDEVSVLGPLGNVFPVAEKTNAFLVAGGVGLPPMLWLSDWLREHDKSCVAFYGAQSRELLAIELGADGDYATDAKAVSRGPDRFSRNGTGLVISTDDGSLGYRGYTIQAMEAFHEANLVDAGELVVYTCGPEIMMKSVARYCLDRGIECYACMERAMACGTGTCQSCVVEVIDDGDADGWRYQLCCTEGPVFAAGKVLWEPAV